MKNTLYLQALWMPDTSITKLCAELQGTVAGDQLATAIHALREFVGGPDFPNQPGHWFVPIRDAATDNKDFIMAFGLIETMLGEARTLEAARHNLLIGDR